VDPELSDLTREYRFRKALGGSHEEFLDQPRQVTDWLLAIDQVFREVERG
jgi:hypothetical protein